MSRDLLLKQERDFIATEPGHKWVGDVTAVATDEGWLSVAPMIALFNREVIGLACGEKNDQNLTLKSIGSSHHDARYP